MSEPAGVPGGRCAPRHLRHAGRAAGLKVDFDVSPDGQAAGCASSTVAWLNPNGDGFLAVRASPGTRYAMLARLSNGDVVPTCAAEGDWIGMVYGPSHAKG